MTQLLAKSFTFTSSYAEYDDRDTMLDAIWPHVVGSTKKIVDLEIFGNGDRLMVRYQLVGAGFANMCEFFRFDKDKVAEIEVFMGKSNFEQPT